MGGIKKISKILIANRGEIAVRILRTCKELGIDTVSVHSTEDENSLHVKLADESVCIGPARSNGSYLNIASVLSAAEITGADAIHPGFGFLSENKEFAQMCEKWNLTFIGPHPDIIECMGDKIRSKELAEKANVPILKTLKVDELSEKELFAEVENMGLPVLIKASAGGGGRGMQRIDHMGDLKSAISRLREEAKAAFGDGTLFIEKFISRPRHIEIQILADKIGNVIHLGERDCTIQRRFQKIIEETPSPVLNETQREKIANAAVKLAKFINYDSVGTVEFLYDLDSGEFYFMEMNTRIQVEHPITEERTGIDLIANQIRVAQGHEIPFQQSDIKYTGHVLECRINAENSKTFAPSPGKIVYYHRPGGIGIRVDDFIYSGYKVSPYYDSMIAKFIVKAPNREACLNRMKRALNEAVITGIQTNIDLHKEILNDFDFRENNYSTDFLNKKMR